MSVIPPQDANLVMTFSEATRVFNSQTNQPSNFINSTPNARSEKNSSREYSQSRNKINTQDNEERNNEEDEPSPSRSYCNRSDNSLKSTNQNPAAESNNNKNLSYLKNPSITALPLDSSQDYSQPTFKNEPLKGRASVIPLRILPTQQQVLENPNDKVEIRNSVRNREIDYRNGNKQQDQAFESREEINKEPYGGDGEARIPGEYIYTNYWFTFRRYMRSYFAEFLGTLILVTWGEGTQAQVVSARKEPSDYLSIAVGWGVGFMLAIFVSSGISGGHINPAVTISLAVFRGFSWKKVPGYILAQTLGGFCGCAIIYGVYYVPLHSLGDLAYAAVLTTGPDALGEKLSTVFFSVFTGAALLMGAISAFTDTGNNSATPGLTPLLLGVVMVGLASSFGYQTGFVLNPARDLGPRLFVWAVGFDTKTLWLADSAYGIWIPTVGTITGALFGNFAYDLLVYNGRNSPVNYNFSRRNRSHFNSLKSSSLNNSNDISRYANGISEGEKGFNSSARNREIGNTRNDAKESTLVGSPAFSSASSMRS